MPTEYRATTISKPPFPNQANVDVSSKMLLYYFRGRPRLRQFHFNLVPPRYISSGIAEFSALASNQCTNSEQIPICNLITNDVSTPIADRICATTDSAVNYYYIHWDRDLWKHVLRIILRCYA